MGEESDKMAGLLETARQGDSNHDLSRATSPGGAPREEDPELKQLSRGRPQHFKYKATLPYEVEGFEKEQEVLNNLIRGLYIAIKKDFSLQTPVWIRQIKEWLGLKFVPTREQRVKLIKLSYEMAMAQGQEQGLGDRFAGLFYLLTKKNHYLRQDELTLDWRPLFRDLKATVVPEEPGLARTNGSRRNPRTLIKICGSARRYFDPKERGAMLDEFLQYFNTSSLEGAYATIGLLNIMFPGYNEGLTPGDPSLPQQYFPTFFHLWETVNRSKVFDATFIDLFSRLAIAGLASEAVPFSEFGLFTREQSASMFTAILRLLEIPVGQSGAVYSSVPDSLAGQGHLLERDQRKHPPAKHIARFIAFSLSPAALDKPVSIMTELEALVQSIETFFHPSNSGAWTRPLSQFVFYICDNFALRWNREQTYDLSIPVERRIDDALKKRFVACLRDVVFMGLYSKSSSAMSYYMQALHTLCRLQPSMILPGALQRIYPSMQGLVEVHRTISSLRALELLAPTMIREKGFRCHVTTLLGLALPGIDANDLDKTLWTLRFFQGVCYNIPFHNLAGENGGSDIAIEWVTGEMERMEVEGAKFMPDYVTELTDEDEEAILQSSTSGLAEFVSSFLGRVFTLLENLPDAARARTGSPEENVMHTLPACFTPLLASLSPELFEMALNKTAEWINNHVVHQARDAMAFIINCFCKIDADKALKRFVPMLIESIRGEIDENGAASTRSAHGEILPRDRAFLWHVSILSMCSVHVGAAVMPFKDDLIDIAMYMQQKCRGSPTVHISNFIHHLLLNLTSLYPLDWMPYEPSVLARGLRTSDWGARTAVDNLTIKWHVPSEEEVQFAYELFEAHAAVATKSVKSLLDGSSGLAHTSKPWSDDLTRDLNLFRLLTSGVASLFDNDAVAGEQCTKPDQKAREQTNGDTTDGDMPVEDDEESLLHPSRDLSISYNVTYAAGYPLEKGGDIYVKTHQTRAAIGQVFHEVHNYLVSNKEDDVQCFTNLYSAYKYWISDVGIEKTAHTLDRVTRIYTSEISPYKFPGVRKDYPRAILLRRAYVYHLQRQRHNAHARFPSELDRTLLHDLAVSCVSTYTDVRKHAQSALDSGCKSLKDVRPDLVKQVLQSFQQGLKTSDNEKIKGSMHLLILGCLNKTLAKDWRYAPDVVRCYLDACDIDNMTIQKICSSATFPIMDFSRNRDPDVFYDHQVLDDLKVPELDADTTLDIQSSVKRIQRKREAVTNIKLELAEELVLMTKTAHWKTASRIAAILITLGLRFKTLGSTNLAEQLAAGTIDVHPGLRSLYTGAFVAYMSLVHTRAACLHDIKKYIIGEDDMPGRVEIKTRSGEPGFTEKYLASYAQPITDHFIDQPHIGWLLWKDSYLAVSSDHSDMLQYDELEQSILDAFGKVLNRDWFSTYFKYLLQEPRDQTADRFRVTNTVVLAHAFDYVLEQRAAIVLDDLKEEIEAAYGDGSTKHQHRTLAEIFAGMIGSVYSGPKELRDKIWDYVMPKVLKIFQDELTPENSGYWNSFIHVVFHNKDPRRSWPMLEWLASFRLDMHSNAAFKESSKIQLLQECITEVGWHFQLEKPIQADFLAHIDHPYKAVREAIGATLGTIYRTRYHESYVDAFTFIALQKQSSSLGARPWQPSDEFATTIREVFMRIETWRHEREPGQQTPSSYTNGSKTVLTWLDQMLSSQECTLLQPFFPELLEPLLHMMDIKEDQELQVLAYHVFRQIPNIPHRAGEEGPLVDAMMRIGRSSPFWHQRLRVLVIVQVFYFRRLFLMTDAQQQALYDCVFDMLADTQLEVRMGAMTTLTGMIRCSRAAIRDRLTEELITRFTSMLLDNPLPKKSKMPRLPSGLNTPTGTGSAAGTSTPTPEHTKLVLTRHAAVLGLGALVQAHPYTSPPPAWVPGVLTTLANKANNDPGVVGKSVKTILADFKKTRQDTWQMDLKAFSAEQVEDLDGVLWKSYFA